MNKLSLLLVLVLGIITGCSQADEDTEAVSTKVPVMIDVEIQTPDSIVTGEETTLTAEVTQGEEKVEDANQVTFEVRQSGQDKGEMIDAVHEGKGVYTVTKTFEQEGTYILVAHVTARDMHHMPSKEVEVINK